MPRRRIDFKGYEKATQHHIIGIRITKHLSDLLYVSAGLSAEVGEVAEKLHRFLRDGRGSKLGRKDRLALAKELGDVLWYLARLSRLLGFSLEEIAAMNVKKIQDRVQRGKIKGEGDER